MADIKISALPGASTLDGTETIPLVQGGTTKKVTTDQFLIKDASGDFAPASGDFTTANGRINLLTVGRGGGGVASNTASGAAALYYNTTGSGNTASGRSGYNPDNDITQYQITTDFDMTLVGYGATKDNAGQLWNSTAIGARAKVTKSNQVVLGDSNVTETLINGDLVQKVSTTAATLTANGTLTFSIVNDTTLRISVRGSDGTTRTATVALS